MRKVTKSRLRRYMVLRLCFRCGRDQSELQNETGMTTIQLVNTIYYLMRNRLIKKEITEKGPVFTLTMRGESRLAYYEYTFQIYQQWSPLWAREGGWAEDYYKEMTILIKKLSCFVE
jgi:hypothetical protein